jgi:hypothetical protein
MPVGTFNGSAYTDVAALIQSGRNGGTWNGSGILSSLASGQFTTLGIATAAQAKAINPGDTALWNGQVVTGSDTLVMYTYAGDANLDGRITVDDYGRIDFNVGLGVGGWFNGDFNYDGKITVDDYGIIDFNVGIQGPPLGGGAGLSAAVSAVPEPTVTMSAGGLGLAAAALRRRRRRR